MASPRPVETVGAPAPRGLEYELRRAFAPMIAQVRATLPRVKSLGDVRALGAALRRRWPDKRVRAIVRRIMVRAEQRAGVGWARWERKAAARRLESAAAFVIRESRIDTAPYDGEALIEKWSRDAAARITSVRDEVAEGLRRDVVAALERGTDPAELAAKWKAEGVPVEFGTLEGRLRTIAQHQIASLHAQVQAERARALGAERFIWRSQEDDKVRPSHRRLHGQIFDYPNGDPVEGLPGQPINCRCYAETVIPDEITIPIGSAFDT